MSSSFSSLVILLTSSWVPSCLWLYIIGVILRALRIIGNLQPSRPQQLLSLMLLSISCIHLLNSGIDNKVLHGELIKIYNPEVQVITGKVSSFAYNPKEKYRKQWLLAENKITNLQVGLLLTSIFFFIVLLPKIFSVPADHIITSL